MTPRNWEQKELGELANFVNGRGFKPHEWSQEGLPIIRIQNLNGSREFNYYGGEYDPKIEVQSGDLLFAWSGSRGTSFGPHFWNGEKAVLNYHTWKVLPTSPNIDKRFLYDALKLLTVRIEDEAHGAAGLVHTQKNLIVNYSILVPPLAEQVKIASILSAWDKAIKLVEKRVFATLNRRRAITQMLITGKRRLVDFARLEWQYQPISEFLTESRVVGSLGDTAKKITVKLYGKGVIQKLDPRQGSSATQYYKRSSGQFIYSKLDFLNGAFGIIPPEMDGFESTLDLPAFDVDSGVDRRWFCYFVSREEFYRTGIRLANGGRKARRVNPKDFLDIRIPVPGLPEQRAIADMIEASDRELLLFRRKLEMLRLQKKGLMQELLTGKLRTKATNGSWG